VWALWGVRHGGRRGGLLRGAAGAKVGAIAGAAAFQGVTANPDIHAVGVDNAEPSDNRRSNNSRSDNRRSDDRRFDHRRPASSITHISPRAEHDDGPTSQHHEFRPQTQHIATD